MSSREGKSIEDIYKKMSQHEHVIARPDTYVGSMTVQTEKMWVWDEAAESMVNKQINFVPGLYKIFDEILVNAADNKIRDPKGMDTLKVDIDSDEGYIRIMNNGRGLPIEVHKEHKVYVPHLVFGHLLTSDNYNDSEKKVTGGRNGYGAKLTNIFSTKFVVVTADSSRGLKYKQIFRNNMLEHGEPKIDKYSGDDYTEVTFYPDWSKFGMTKFDEDIRALMMKRVYDIAGSIGGDKCKVYLNGKRLAIKSFKEYCDLYLKTFNMDPPVPRVHEKVNDRWEIVISLSDPKEGAGQFQQVSFVNSICTTKGGTHVNHVVDKFVPKILEKVDAKNKKGLKCQPYHVKNHLWVFINCLIENPAFDSQTKETLTTKIDQFGSKCAVTDACIAKVLKMGVVDQIVNWIRSKQDQNISKMNKAGGGSSSSRLMGIPKLEDANDAGTKNGDKCTLILTEGDSAKALAVAGLGVVGRDKFGVFPLRGKLLNVRDATYSQTIENKEVQALMKIVGIDPSKSYSSTKGLRYGSVMLMTDQDHDGSHIKGLLINMIHHWWPSLCKMDGFLKEFVTPIVKVTKGTGSGTQILEFFTMTEYEQWKERNNDGAGWKTKYYKGLGTSTAKEAREYFSNVVKHRIDFKWLEDADGEAIDMAFNKKRADDRKEWINAYEDGVCVDHRVKTLRYLDFINKELVQFSKYDVMRSIPSVVDGLKPGQRKVLFCTFKKNLKSDIKVAQFIGYVSEQSAYHHGEQSLESTIVGMAQDFVGSNNVNLLFPSGQFGTRLQGGKDCASGRYIYTRLCDWTRKIYAPSDDALLNYQSEEGQSIEPKWYCPVIPMVLVNGGEGIGTGWSTSVPCYDVREVINNLRSLLRGNPLKDMIPSYRGFTGGVESNGKGGFEFSGTIKIVDEDIVEITELPVKTWTQSYKEFLTEMLADFQKKVDKGDKKKEQAGAKSKPKKRSSEDANEDEENAAVRGNAAPSPVLIKDFKEYHTEHTVRFRVEMAPDQLVKAETLGLEKVFKLKSTMGTSNMVLFDPFGKIRRYDSALEIIEEFAVVRLDFYVKRRSYMLSKLMREIEICENKKKFLTAVVSGNLKFANRKIDELVKEIKLLGIKSMDEICDCFKLALPEAGREESVAARGGDASDDDTSGLLVKMEEGTHASIKKGYDYLLGLSLWNLTMEKLIALEAEIQQKYTLLNSLKGTSPEMMWDADLVELLVALDLRDAELLKEMQKVYKKVDGGRELKRSRSEDQKDMNAFAGDIVPVTSLKALQPKPQVWRKPEVVGGSSKVKAADVKTEQEMEIESLGKALGVSTTESLFERLMKKTLEQRKSLDGESSKPPPPPPVLKQTKLEFPVKPVVTAKRSLQKEPLKRSSSPLKKKRRSDTESSESDYDSSDSGSSSGDDSSGSDSSSDSDYSDSSH